MVSPQVASTEVAFGDRDGSDGLASSGPSTGNLAASAEGADPQSIGALARAMRTQCTQLVGHLMVLLRNLTEACQGALKEKGSLPGKSVCLCLCHFLIRCSPPRRRRKENK